MSIMQCVKCEEGELQKIKFNKTGKIGYVCTFCRTFWIKGELITYNTGHALDPYHPGDEDEYAVQELNQTDEDHQQVKNTRIL